MPASMAVPESETYLQKYETEILYSLTIEPNKRLPALHLFAQNNQTSKVKQPK